MQNKKVYNFKLMHASKEENFQQTKESVESAALWRPVSMPTAVFVMSSRSEQQVKTNSTQPLITVTEEESRFLL